MAADLIKEEVLCNLQLEKAILGSLISDYNLLHQAGHDIERDSFFLELHREFYEFICFLLTEDGRYDVNSIIANRDYQELTLKFNNAFLTDCVAEASIINFENNVKLFKAYYLRRQLHTIGYDLVKDTSKGDNNPYKTYEELTMTLADLSRAAGTIQIVNAAKGLDEYEKMPPKKMKSTGFAKLDANWNGGVYDTDLITIGARSGMGKTAFICSGSYNLACKGKNSIIFSLEMSYEQLYCRQLSIHTGETYNNIMQKTFANTDLFWERYFDFKENIAPHIYYVDKSGMTYGEIVMEVKRLARQFEIEAVYVDYLQKSIGEATNLIRNQVINAVVALKNCAKEFGVPMYVLSQMKRDDDNKGNPAPNKTQIIESGKIEDESDRIILLYRPYYYYAQRLSKGINDESLLMQYIDGEEQSTQDWGQVLFEKDRHGGDYKNDIWMPFDGHTMRWCDSKGQLTKLLNQNQRLNRYDFEEDDLTGNNSIPF